MWIYCRSHKKLLKMNHQDNCKCGVCESIESGVDQQEALNRLIDLENKAMLKHVGIAN